jgi:hypothetical protein
MPPPTPTECMLQFIHFCRIAVLHLAASPYAIAFDMIIDLPPAL